MIGCRVLRIRPMTGDDIPDGMRFKDAAGWNQTEEDWDRFLAMAPGGCFVAEVSGEVVGTATTCRFGQDCGWVAMVLVAPEHRRKGIGTALFRHAVAYLEDQGVRSVKLDATPVGRAVYLRDGFADEYELERREGVARDLGSYGVIAMARYHLGAVLALDRPIYGTDRGVLLTPLFEESLTREGSFSGVFLDRHGELHGYAMVRPGSRAAFVGPIVALTEEAGTQLFGWSLGRVAGQPVFLDIPPLNPFVVRLAESAGLSVQRPFTRMYRGLSLPGNPARVYATSGPEKG